MWEAHRYGFTCFCCQQTLEAILKAAIVEIAKKEYPKIHDLPKLYVESGLKGGEKYLTTLDEITRHYYQVRYPDIVKRKYSRKIAEETLENTKEIFQWIKKKLSRRFKK